jgi:hypothetical protein
MRLYQISIIALTIRHYRTNERKGTSDYNSNYKERVSGLGGKSVYMAERLIKQMVLRIS